MLGDAWRFLNFFCYLCNLFAIFDIFAFFAASHCFLLDAFLAILGIFGPFFLPLLTVPFWLPVAVFGMTLSGPELSKKKGTHRPKGQKWPNATTLAILGYLYVT